MRGGGCIFYVKTDRRVGADVVDVPLWVVRIRCIARRGQEQKGVVVVATVRRVVHVPDKVATSIEPEAHGNVDRRRRSTRCNTVERNRLRKSIVSTWIRSVDVSCRSRQCTAIGILVINRCERVRLVCWFRTFPSSDGRSHPKGISWLASRCHYYICALANLDRE